MELRGREVRAGAAGPDVAQLHDELTVLGFGVARDELAGKTFGRTTHDAVLHFQQRSGLSVTGVVDARTAAALTAALAQRGGGGAEATTAAAPTVYVSGPAASTPSAQSSAQPVGYPAQPPLQMASSASFQIVDAQWGSVTGSLLTPNGSAFADGLVRAYDLGPDGQTLRPLGEAWPGVDGHYRIAYPVAAVQALGKRSADLVMAIIDKSGRTLAQTEVMRSAAVDAVVDVTVGAAAPPGVALSPGVAATAGVASTATANRTVKGRIYGELGLPAAGSTLRLYHRGFGCGGRQLAETVTGADGDYEFAYALDGPSNVEVRAVAADGTETAISEPIYGAGDNEVLNLVVPHSVAPISDEHHRLALSLQGHIGRAGSIGEAKENDECQDITLLARNTGWDARLVALAATADQLSRQTGVAQDALYALLRAGIPADAAQLAHLDPATVDAAFTHAAAAKVSGLSSQQIAEAKAALANHAATYRRANVTSPGALSTLADLLAQTGLTESQQTAFEGLALNHEGAELWEKASEIFPAPTVQKLQLHGKLAYLTFNNAPVMARLMQEIASEEQVPSVMLRHNLHDASGWRAYLGGGGRAAVEVPPAYTGATEDERLAAYAEDLARKVRLAMPTHVVAKRLETGEMKVPDQSPQLFLTLRTAADMLDFQLKSTPVKPFLVQHHDMLFAGMPEGEVVKVKQGMATLQRIYQVTPDDQTMKVLLDNGFESAYEITSMDQDRFIGRFAAALGSEGKARLVYRKAVQVSSVTYSAFGAASQAANSGDIFGMAASPAVAQESKNNIIKHYPTLEDLFGGLDFCECDHCRSVLSPAAYLVDMLRFLDPHKAVWKSSDPTPYAILEKRRPDLIHLPLTCENTNTVLPYIDIVNEILEYSVAFGALAKDAGHDVGNARTEDLLAEPANVLAQAYEKLKATVYPIGLPFDLWLETVRRYLEALNSPLPTVLEALGPGETADTALTEHLGLTPGEHKVLTDPQQHAAWFELYGYAPLDDALTELKSAKTLASRLGVSYRELIDLLRTDFVNPGLDALVVLRTLGIDVQDMRRYKALPGDPMQFSQDEKDAFEAHLAAQSDVLDVKAWLDASWPTGFDKILVLADTTPSCGFESTEVRHLDGTPAGSDDFLRLTLLVRLQRKLGWKLSELDSALRVFMQGSVGSPTAAMAAALTSLAQHKLLTSRVKAGRDARIALLSLWAPMDENLYAKLLLTPGVRAADPVFASPFGRYLSRFDTTAKTWIPNSWLPGPADSESQAAGNVGLVHHLPAIQAAFGMTAEEIGLALADGGKVLAEQALTLDIVTLIYRYQLLAKALKLSMRELVTLKQLSGTNPFATPKDTLRFVETAGSVRISGVRAEELDFLLRHQFDPTGPYRPDPAALLALIHALNTAIGAIETEHATPSDPLSLTDEVIVQKAPLALPSDVATTFVGMWQGTALFHTSIASAAALDVASFASERAITVSHDGVDRQWLAYRGVLSDAERTRLTTKFTMAGFSDLLADVQQQARTFFDTQLLGVFDDSDFGLFFLVDPAWTAAEEQQWQHDRRERLGATMLTHLRDRLTRDVVIAALAADLKDRPELITMLLDDTLANPSLATFAAARSQGFSGDFFASPDLTGAPLSSAILGNATTASKPAGVGSVRVDGYLFAPVTGKYRFDVKLAQGSRAELRLSHLVDPLAADNTGAEPVEFGITTELRAGIAYRFTLSAMDLADGRDVEVTVRSEGLGKGPISRLNCHPAGAVEAFRVGYTVLGKVLRLSAALDLSVVALRHMLMHSEDFGGLNLSALPASAASDGSVLFGQYLRLVRYAQLRKDVGANGDELIDIFRAAHRVGVGESALLQDVIELFATLSRRPVDLVQEAVNLLGHTSTDFTHEPGLRRLWTVLSLAQKLGVGPAAVGRWATTEPTEMTVKDLRGTLKARYEPEAWRRVTRPVSDVLRQKRRDSLVAFLLDREQLARVEQLYEMFLIDPGTEPVVQTSRLRQAISSVQLFVQRCLMNLELEVKPSALNASHWEWMKRYRVWEANRKIFLWPENWLEPEWRDDKTHLFRELEGTLLQGEVTQDLAEDSLFKYLQGLEGLAKLEIMSTWLEEDAHDPASNTLHVLARTATDPTYFYRRYAHHAWTPWEPVSTEIKGDHVVLAVWRNRPCVFWLTFLEEPQAGGPPAVTLKQDQASSFALNVKPPKLKAQLNWSEYVNGEWSAGNTSGFGRPLTMKIANPFFDRSRLFVHAVARKTEDADEVTIVLSDGGKAHQPAGLGNVIKVSSAIGKTLFGVSAINTASALSGIVSQTDADQSSNSVQLTQTGAPSNHVGLGIDGIFPAFHLVSRNSPAEPSIGWSPIAPPFTWTGVESSQYKGSGSLYVKYTKKIDFGSGKPVETPGDSNVLGKGGEFRLVIPPSLIGSIAAPEISNLMRPFFYQNKQHVFYVEPELTERTFLHWDSWVIQTAFVPPAVHPGYWEEIELIPSAPVVDPPLDISPLAKFTLQTTGSDVFLGAGNAFQYDQTFLSN